MLLRFRMPILLFAIVAVQLVSVVLARQYTRVTVTSLPQSLNKIPSTLDGWTSQDVESDPALVRAVDADDLMDRQYSKNQEWPVAVHTASWASLEHWCPHPPLECYPGAGWQVKQAVIVPTALGEHEGSMHWVEFTKATQSLQVLYWFQRGGDVFHDREGARKSRQNLWGKSQCAPLVKVILQTDSRAGERGKKNLQQLATELQRWVKQQSASDGKL